MSARASTALADAKKYADALERAIAPAAARARDALERAIEDEDAWRELLAQLDALDARDDPAGAFDALVDLGGDVKVRARVPSARGVFVDVGLGFLVEMTRAEARARAERAFADAEGERASREDALRRAEARVREFESGIRALIGLG